MGVLINPMIIVEIEKKIIFQPLKRIEGFANIEYVKSVN